METLKLTKEERNIIIDKVIAILNNIQPDIQVKVMIGEEESYKLKLTKESFAIKVRDYISQSYPKSFIFNRFDEDWNILFDLTLSENTRLKAIKELEENDSDASIYIEDYRLLLISDCGAIIGQISDIELDHAEEAEIMVRMFDGMYGVIMTDYDSLKDLYLKEYENIKAWQEKKANLINDSIALN